MTMRLDKVELVGFKSFCDKQELSFQGGVTGIVGPNGCGKSNISDAISWVLGEQSAKSLRGAAMEDVIFAGSQSRQPVGMAEVNLRVSGLNGNSPDGSPECVVTRRLYRNGESEYLMNGQICRLRDIHELFMDTGLGSKAYSIIEQGKIGQILSTKPADRRALIEEAAGITKYRVRRKQTALKLEAAQQNLLRVNDIVIEVEKQLDSLKRQAGKARRYRAQREEMQAIERVLFGRRHEEIIEQMRVLHERFEGEGEREKAMAVVIGSEEAQLSARRTQLYDEETQLEQARARLNELTLAVERHQGKSGYCKEQITQTDVRATEARLEADELEARVGPLAESLDARQSDEQRLREELQGAEEAGREADTAVQQSTTHQAAVEAEQDAARDGQVELLGRIATLQNARQSVAAALERAAADLLKIQGETEELERERAKAGTQRAAAQTRDQEYEALLSELTSAREAALGRAASARARAEALARESEGLQSEYDSLAGRLASLNEMVATHSAFDEGVRALLARPEGIEVLGVVADSIETDETHERALEALLGDRLQAVLTSDREQAVRAIQYLRESGAGRCAFLPVATARTKAPCDLLREIARSESPALGLLSDFYRVTGPHAAEIRAALPDAIVVETLADAFELIARQGPVACVTRDGETLRGSLLEGGRSVKGLLAPRREIREAESKQAEIEQTLKAAREGVAQAASQAELAANEARELEGRIHAAEKERVGVRHDLAVVEEELARIARKAGVLTTERRQFEDERQGALARSAEIEQTLTAVEQNRAQSVDRLAELAAIVTQARSATEAAQAHLAEVRSALAALRERVTAAQAETRRLTSDREELAARIATARHRNEELVARRAELLDELAEAERALMEGLTQRDRLLGEVAIVEDRVRDLRNELDGREQALKERRREHDMLRDALQDLSVSRARAEADIDHLARECHQAINVTAAEAAATLTDEDKLKDLNELLQQVQEIRDRLERMGPVNVLAVEQSQEYEERYEFLVTQRQDLLDSIAELDQAIRKIDKTSRERFREAFQAINQHFSEIFTQLFGGGAAGLSLIDEEDLLESGIDVMAQPPGKRLQSVMLLSGGEKAMTAIALLFAIFQYKPSPFCILDEVDAPLDDANIGRFVKMLEGLKEQTQFVLITHSRKTMEIADQLYGVTMEEPGVSKLVSVRFN